MLYLPGLSLGPHWGRLLLSPQTPSFITMSFTSVARILQWGRGGENDITFRHTLYTGADPESFGGVDVILNQIECLID